MNSFGCPNKWMHCAVCVGCDPSPSMCEHGMDPGLLAVEILLTFQPSLVSLEAHMQGGGWESLLTPMLGSCSFPTAVRLNSCCPQNIDVSFVLQH